MLIRHASAACEAVDTIDVEARFGAPDELILAYTVRGTIPDLCIPAVCAPRRADELWRHTCFEAFVQGCGPRYLEINLSPSTQWAAYRFDAYRQGMEPAPLEAPRIGVRCRADRLEVTAALRLPASDAAEAGAGRRLALAAVIEETGGRLSWWALAHPAVAPDFHHPLSFVFRP